MHESLEVMVLRLNTRGRRRNDPPSAPRRQLGAKPVTSPTGYSPADLPAPVELPPPMAAAAPAPASSAPAAAGEYLDLISPRSHLDALARRSLITDTVRKSCLVSLVNKP